MPSQPPIIGILTADSPPSVGGIGRHVEVLADGLRAAGEHVEVFDVRSLPAYRFGRNIGASFSMSRAVAAWIARQNIGILNIHCGPGGVLPWKSVWAGIPMICTANHTYAQQARMPGQQWKRLLVPWERRGYALADRIVCISSDTQHALVHRYGVAPGIVSVVPCGFSLPPWIAADTEPGMRNRHACVFIGRPQSRKGWDILIRSWRHIRNRLPEARLSVVGWKEESRDGMEFLGRLDDAALRSLVGSARLLLAPSRLEGFGLAAAEAIAAGTPVVGLDSDGLRTTVPNGVTGVLCRQDVQCFANAVVHLLQDDVHWLQLHDHCRRHRNVFSLEREVSAYRSLFAAVYSRS